jgi:hypothetical protein
MRNPNHFLVNNRAGVEFGSSKVCRSSNQLDAAGVSLVIRLGANESGQETVVNVDNFREISQERVRDDLEEPRGLS